MDIKVQEDNKLIKSIKDGDRESEGLLYDKYQKILHCYLRNKFPTYQDIEDDVSEILIKMFVSFDSYDQEKGKFKTWSITIANNYMIDKSRSSTFINSSGFINVDFNNISTNTSVSNYNNSSSCIDLSDMSSTHTSACFSNGFDNCSAVSYVNDYLDSCDFTFLNMHYGLGYSYSEIGTEFNITSNTVSNRVNYIKSKIRDNIDKDTLY